MHDLASHSAAAAFLAEWVLNLESRGASDKKELPPVNVHPKMNAKNKFEFKKILYAQKQAEKIEFENHLKEMEKLEAKKKKTDALLGGLRTTGQTPRNMHSRNQTITPRTAAEERKLNTVWLRTGNSTELM